MSMSSYRGHQYFFNVGEQLRKTIDCFTWGGFVQLTNNNKQQLEIDFERIDELCATDLFIVE